MDNNYKTNCKSITDMRKVKLSEEDELVINKIVSERGIQNKTVSGYVDAVKNFVILFNTSLTSKLEIYSDEEETLPWKKRTLKHDLIMYRSYLQSKYLKSTVKIYFVRLCTIFRHLELEIHHLPPLNTKNLKDLPPITYVDLLDKSIIQKAINVCNPIMKAIIIFMCSSGCARRETLNLTIDDYLKANNVSKVSEVDTSLVPTFKIRRQKTDKYYFTYCTPEANEFIKQYLLTRDDLTLNDKLFDINLYYFNKYFNEINSILGLGKVRKYNRFRGHMLRKFNASTLYNNGMSMEDVDSLQGRGKDSTHRSYFMDDPSLLKQKYIEYIPVLTIN